MDLIFKLIKGSIQKDKKIERPKTIYFPKLDQMNWIASSINGILLSLNPKIEILFTKTKEIHKMQSETIVRISNTASQTSSWKKYK